MIVAADIHLKEGSAKTVLEQVFTGLWSALHHDPDKTLALLGDIYHFRYRVSVELQNRVYAFLEFLVREGNKVILLPGNHDQIDEKGENALEIFQAIPGIKVYTEPTEDEWGRWIPYRKKNEDILVALGHPPKRGVLWMHHGIRGAWMNNNRKDTEGLSLEWFKPWYRVNCGHYHLFQTIENVIYVGSPYQTKADEAGQLKGYGVWNRASLEMMLQVRHWGKKYHNVKAMTDGGVELDGVDKKDELRITVPANVDPETVGKRLLADGFENVVVVPDVEVAKERLNVKSESIYDYAEAYANKFGGPFGVDDLMETYKEIAGTE